MGTTKALAEYEKKLRKMSEREMSSDQELSKNTAHEIYKNATDGKSVLVSESDYPEIWNFMKGKTKTVPSIRIVENAIPFSLGDSNKHEIVVTTSFLRARKQEEINAHLLHQALEMSWGGEGSSIYVERVRNNLLMDERVAQQVGTDALMSDIQLTQKEKDKIEIEMLPDEVKRKAKQTGDSIHDHTLGIPSAGERIAHLNELVTKGKVRAK